MKYVRRRRTKQSHKDRDKIDDRILSRSELAMHLFSNLTNIDQRFKIDFGWESIHKTSQYKKDT